MHITDTSNAREFLSRLLESPGDEIITAQSGKRLIRLTPLARVLRPQGGLALRRKLWVAEDADAPDPGSEKPSNGDGV